MENRVYWVPETVYGTYPSVSYYSPFLKRQFNPKFYKRRTGMSRKHWRIVNRALRDKNTIQMFFELSRGVSDYLSYFKEDQYV